MRSIRYWDSPIPTSNLLSSTVLRPRRSQLAVFISEPDQGLYDALNKGIAHASGDVVGFLHADDLFATPDALARIAEAFEDSSIDAIYGDLVYVSKADPKKVIRFWKAGDFSFASLKNGWMPPHPTFYARRSIYERLGAFDTSFHIAADYDCMLRILAAGKLHCRYIPEVLVRMRLGGKSNRSLRNLIRKSTEDYKALKSNHIGGIGTLIMKNVRKIPQFFLKPGA